MRQFVNFGLENWGSDQSGVNHTRRFLLVRARPPGTHAAAAAPPPLHSRALPLLPPPLQEWMSFLHRYVPVGLLERMPLRINDKPPALVGRDDLETLLASSDVADWVAISEMLLGPVEDGFTFVPKHKSNSYNVASEWDDDVKGSKRARVEGADGGAVAVGTAAGGGAGDAACVDGGEDGASEAEG